MNEAHGHDEASGVKRRRYVPDCGTSTHKFLSYAAAIQTRKFYRPGRESAGERRSYAVCEDFGAHQPRCLQRCGLVVERRPLVCYGEDAMLKVVPGVLWTTRRVKAIEGAASGSGLD